MLMHLRSGLDINEGLAYVQGGFFVRTFDFVQPLLLITFSPPSPSCNFCSILFLLVPLISAVHTSVMLYYVPLILVD